MQIVEIHSNDRGYPSSLRENLNSQSPEVLITLGNTDLLKRKSLAVFSSMKCPGNLILKSYDFAQELRQKGTPVISGFHSPVEKEFLTVLLRGSNPLIICPARSLENMRINKEYWEPLDQGRLLFVSPFAGNIRRPTVDTVQYRNRLVAALAEEVFIAYAEPGGKTEQLAREVISWGKPVYTFEDGTNKMLVVN